MKPSSGRRPDGYTLLCATSRDRAIIASLYPKLNYDPVKDLTAVAWSRKPRSCWSCILRCRRVRRGRCSIVARGKPGGLRFASSGTGTTTHLALELFKYLASSVRTLIEQIQLISRKALNVVGDDVVK